MAITAQQQANGNLWEVYQDGQRTGTGTRQWAEGQLSSGRYQPVSGSNLQPTTPVVVPPNTTTVTDGISAVARGQGALAVPPPQQTTQQNTTSQSFEETIRQYLAPPTSQYDLYQQELQSSGYLEARRAEQARRDELNAANSEAEAVKAEIQAVVDKGKANTLKLEKEAEGRGMPTEILSRQQAEVNRQSAIEVLPLQAKALAAQARVSRAGGNLESAQRSLQLAQDQLNLGFKLKSEDAKNKYDYNKEIRNLMYEYADKQQTKLLDEAEKTATRNHSSLQDSINNAQAISMAAMNNGDFEVAVKLGQLTRPDSNSSTFSQDLAKYNSDVAVLQGQIKPKPKAESVPSDIQSFKMFFPNVDISTPAGQQTYLNWKAREGAAGRKPGGDTAQPLSILDVQRYQELYPEAGIQAGDTEASANQKVQKVSSPEGQLASVITNFKNQGLTYDKVVEQINSSATIQDKAMAKKVADTIYGQSVSTAPSSRIEQDIADIKTAYSNIPKGVNQIDIVKRQLAQRGYTNKEIMTSSVGSNLDKFVLGISDFLFGK